MMIIFDYISDRLMVSSSSSVSPSSHFLSFSSSPSPCRRLHLAYTNAIANPFYVPGAPIHSKKFDGVVRGLLGLREA